MPDRRLSGKFSAVFEQAHSFSGQKLPGDPLQLLTPAGQAGRPEVEDMAAIADPTLLGRERWPLAITPRASTCCSGPNRAPSPVAALT